VFHRTVHVDAQAAPVQADDSKSCSSFMSVA